jgi:hypothetical protein
MPPSAAGASRSTNEAATCDLSRGRKGTRSGTEPMIEMVAPIQVRTMNPMSGTAQYQRAVARTAPMSLSWVSRANWVTRT